MEHNGQNYTFNLPRQQSGSGISLVDYFRNQPQGLDIVGLFLVTMGPKISEATDKIYQADNYNQYLLLHGYGVQAAETLASYCHAKMREELRITTGKRYSFGYSACPDLDLQQTLFDLLGAEAIGVSLTPTYADGTGTIRFSHGGSSSPGELFCHIESHFIAFSNCVSNQLIPLLQPRKTIRNI